MIYSIANPHDQLTIESESLEIAAVAVAIMGTGKYGLLDENGDTVMPTFITGGHEEWFTEQFGHSFAASMEWATSAEHMLELVEALDSVVCGSRDEYSLLRAEAKEAGKNINEVRSEWHGRQVTSTIDVAVHAWEVSAHLRRQLANGRL